MEQDTSSSDSLSILSFNMQVGIGTKRYHEYVTRGWRHLLPSQDVRENLTRIAGLLNDHDIIGLQEIDAGSQRSRYENQIETLAKQAGFDYWQVQVNRNLGPIAQHGLGLISRFPPLSISEHKLPGLLPGRGALMVKFGSPEHSLVVIVTHLSLGASSRTQQLAAICELIDGHENVIVMGDTNCTAADLQADPALTDSRLIVCDRQLVTFPSWRPRRGIDHILISDNLSMQEAQVIDTTLSDHRPVAMRISLPPGLRKSLAGGADTTTAQYASGQNGHGVPASHGS